MPVITSPSGVDLLTTTYLLLTQLNPEYSWLLVVGVGLEPTTQPDFIPENTYHFAIIATRLIAKSISYTGRLVRLWT
jgi:hypothetical protein